MRHRILQVFNRYVHPGGEEKSVDRIYEHLQEVNDVSRCFFDSREWIGDAAPPRVSQLRRMFYNAQSRREFEAAAEKQKSDVAVFHNLYPVASPSLYHASLQRGLPVVQFLHNFRPFSVSGTLYAGGRLMPEALRGSYRREVFSGSWQGSVLKSALFALLLKRLHRSGWLESVKQWVAISEFMRDRLIESGVQPERITALRHSWDAMPVMPEREDRGAYLFLGRLVDVKGIAPLLQAWLELRTQLGERTPKLVIAGEGPLESLVVGKDNPSVEYVGMLTGAGKAEALRTCRALVVPSVWWEPLGLVMYEAYDHGKPVLAARSGGMTEALQQGVTGLLHEPGDVGGLVNDVLRMEQTDPAQRLAMGDAGRQWLLSEASPKSWKLRMQAILDGVR